MDCNTGRLIARSGRACATSELPAGFDPVPDNLAAAARCKLAGLPQAQVNLRSRSPLAQWARKKRLQKIAAQSRRRNRK